MLDEDDDDYDELLGDDDEWEDQEALETIVKGVPLGWTLVKVSNYTAKTLIEMDEWLSDNMVHDYKRIGWRSYCSSMVGVQFEDSTDAVYFRLRYSL